MQNTLEEIYIRLGDIEEGLNYLKGRLMENI